MDYKTLFYTEIRTFENGEDFIYDVIDADTLEDAIENGACAARRLGGKVMVNVFDTRHMYDGAWCVYSETKNTWRAK